MKIIILLLLATILNHECTAQQKDTVAGKSARQLQAVTITAKTPLIRQEADRIIYNLQADPQSKVSSVLDMMHKVPYISVDIDDNILLNGSTSYKILINGRPSGLVVRNPKEVLRSIPASIIKSIEVITNPSAHYDGEGLAGIINIVTIKQTGNGYKGSVNGAEKSPVGGAGTGGSFTLKQTKLDLSALAGVNQYNVPKTNRGIDRTGTDSSTLQQQTGTENKGYTAYAGLELSYEADSLNLISGELNWNNSESRSLSEQSSALTGNNYMQSYQLNNNNNNTSNGLDATVNYQRGFKVNKEQLLTFSYQYLKHSNALRNDIAFFNKINDTTPDYRQHNSEIFTDHTIQADYVQPVKSLTAEAGVKGVFRKNESDFSYCNLNPISGRYETDLTRSNIFNNEQDVLSFYNSYDYKKGDWQLRAGVRIEETILKMSYNHGLAPLQEQYRNVLPGIFINRKLKGSSNIHFSFSKRIQRPSTAELNPFVDRSDPNFQTSGNPYLQPITSNAYELSYLRSGKANIDISFGGLFFKNVFSAFPSYDPISNTSFTQYENYGRGRVLKVNIALNYSISPKWHFILNTDTRHIAVDGAGNNISIKNSGFSVYLYASSGYNPAKGWRINADITYKMGGILLPIGSTSGYTASSFNLSKNVIRSNLTLAASVSNPFTKYNYTDEAIGSVNFIEISHKQSYYRRFTISLNYNFGKLKEDIRKNKRGIRSDEGAGN